MNHIYRHSEKVFEKITSVATAVLGNSVTFVFALVLVLVFWFSNPKFYTQDISEILRDVIHGIIFLSLFIIQKSFNHFSASLHLKINELVSSHAPASNIVINVEEKTEQEITELAKVYTELAEQAEEKQEVEAKRNLLPDTGLMRFLRKFTKKK